MARLDELYGEMVAGGTTGLMPQWVPYHTCDTPDKSCARQPVPLNASVDGMPSSSGNRTSGSRQRRNAGRR